MESVLQCQEQRWWSMYMTASGPCCEICGLAVSDRITRTPDRLTPVLCPAPPYRPPGQRLQLVGPMLQAGSDAVGAAAGRSRSAEQQRRVANRERCRDAFFSLVRQVRRRARGAAAGAVSAALPPVPPLLARLGDLCTGRAP